MATKSDNGRRKWTALLITIGTLVAGTIVLSLVKEVFVLPWQAMTKTAHKEDVARLQTKEKHGHDKVMVEQRVYSLEESDKIRIQEIDTVEKDTQQIKIDMTEVKYILREWRRKQ